MNSNNPKLKKTSRIIAIAVRIVEVILLFSIAFNIYMAIEVINTGAQKQIGDPLTAAIQSISISVIVLIALFIISSVLNSIKLDYTPFTDKNVARLKAVAILITIIEPIIVIINFISNMLRPVSAEGFKITIHTYMSGMVIVLGLIIFCIALVFEYGSYLQKQSDETL